MNDIIDHKIAKIHHSLTRIREIYHLAKDNFGTDYTSQDSITLNLQRVCQASIDLANHLNRTLFSQFPEDSRESFETLSQSGFISAELALNLQELVDFSHDAVCCGQTFSLEIVKHLVGGRLSDFEDFTLVVKSIET